MTKLVAIIIIQLIYVPLLTLRTICMVKNLKAATVLFGILEAMVYIFGLALVLTGNQSYFEMFVYAAGYGLGLFVGILVEQKLAIGYTSLHVNTNRDSEDMVKRLRQMGFGVTVYAGQGRYGERKRIDILTQRKREKEVIDIVLAMEPKAFIIVYEPKNFRGGYLTEIMTKNQDAR